MQTSSFTLRTKSLLLSAALAVCLSACSTGPDDPLAAAQAAYDRNEYSAARIHILSLLKEDSAHAEANLIFGKSLLKMGDGVAAAAAFKKILNHEKYAEQANLYHAHALLISGSSKKVLEAMAEPGADISNETAARIYWLRASALLNTQKYEEALASVDAGLARTPQDADLLAFKGQYLLNIGDVKEARAVAKTAITHNPNHLQALLLSGRLAMAFQELQEAKEIFQKTQKIYPENMVPLFSLAAIHADLGEKEKSKEYFDTILRISPEDPLAFSMLAQQEYDKGNIVKAHELLQTAGETVADTPETILLSGKIAHKRGNHELAIDRLQRHLRIVPGHVDATTYLGEALVAAGNDRQAYRIVKPIAERATATPALLKLAARLGEQQNDPQAKAFAARTQKTSKVDVTAQMKKADSAIKSGDWQQADIIYAKLRAAGQQGNPVLLNNSAYVALELGDAAKAVKLARAAHALAPDDPYVRDTLGWMLLKENVNTAEALVHLKAAVKIVPENIEILGHLADAFAANGNDLAAGQIRAKIAS